MTKKGKRDYGRYQILGSRKYARFYAMYDLHRIREPEPYSELTEMQKTIINESILELDQTIQTESIPKRIRKIYRVTVSVHRIRNLTKVPDQEINGIES